MSAPKNLSGFALSNSEIYLEWESNPSATKYDIYVNDSLYKSTSSTNYTVTDLSPKTTYKFYVVASNENYISSTSNLIQVITTAHYRGDINQVPTSATRIGHGEYWYDLIEEKEVDYYYMYLDAGNTYALVWCDSNDGSEVLAEEGLYPYADVVINMYLAGETNSSKFNCFEINSGYTDPYQITPSESGYYVVEVVGNSKSRGYYLVDEFVLFMNVISTIVRQRTDVTIYMLGNTVNWSCPYFTEMGIKHIKDMKQGSIDVYEYGESGLKVAVEYCQSIADSKQSNVYFAFDNPRLQMITTGAWEIALYPHLPVKYKPKDIKGIFFIIFEGDTLQCEVIKIKSNAFIYIHRKSTPIHDYDNDMIFQINNDYRINHYQSLVRPRDKRSNVIAFLIKQNKVYYQDNEVGEIVRNYRQSTD